MPHVTAVDRQIFAIFAADISCSDCEVYIEPMRQTHGKSIFHTAPEPRFSPYVLTGNAGDITLGTEGNLKQQYLRVHADVVAL